MIVNISTEIAKERKEIKERGKEGGKKEERHDSRQYKETFGSIVIRNSSIEKL